MLSRKETPFLIDLPNEWVDSVYELMQSTYQKKLSEKGLDFKIFGKLYKSELLMIASLVDPNNDVALPTSYFVSIDLDEGQDHTKLLNTLVDSIGAFFDQFFADDSWMDYQDLWKDEKFKDLDLFVKVTRENVELSIKADQLLNQ